MDWLDPILDIVRRLNGDGLSLRRSNGELRRWITLALSAERTLRLGSEAVSGEIRRFMWSMVDRFRSQHNELF